MPTHKEDEPLGIEQLPQTELDTLPGAGEKSDSAMDTNFKGKPTKAEAEKPGSVKPTTDDAQAE